MEGSVVYKKLNDSLESDSHLFGDIPLCSRIKEVDFIHVEIELNILVDPHWRFGIQSSHEDMFSQRQLNDEFRPQRLHYIDV